MTNTFFTSDTHFAHANILHFQKDTSTRGELDAELLDLFERKGNLDSEEKFRFKTLKKQAVREHDLRLISEWNHLIAPDDTVYHLGDVCFGSPNYAEEILQQLNGKIHLILGNHDRIMKTPNLGRYFTSVQHYLEVKFGKQEFMLSHYPMLSWNKMRYGSYHLYGHTHGAIPYVVEGYSLDVGIDNLGKPWHLHEVLNHLQSKQNGKLPEDNRYE